MRVILLEPGVEVGLQIVDAAIELLRKATR
jgi:hypothetical protein